MKRFRGFLIKHRVGSIFRCLRRRNRSTSGYRQLNPSPECETNYISKICSWGKHLKTKAVAICSSRSGLGYRALGHEPIREKAVAVPKGHMAVYVGQKDGDFMRVSVPVMYFNHPLFGQLLREAEEEFGYDHPGGITIPCRISEFENVKHRIAAGHGGRKLLMWKHA